MNTVELLTYAKGRVQRAWAQCESITDEGAVCATGAVFATNPRGQKVNFHIRNKAAGYLREALRQTEPENLYGLPSWNDQPNRTKKEVLALYDTAIKNAKRRHIRGD